jgi:ABC-type dipeptide/oligopeptide/nickel transport system ATPase component
MREVSRTTGCAFHTRCPFARERCQAERPALRKLGDRDIASHFAEKFA